MEVALFLALLALVAQAGVVLLAVTAVLSPFSAVAARVLDELRLAVGGHELVLAWAVAATATAGSLYFSEIEDFPPCPLCWYQRIFMYPLVIVLGVAAQRRERRVAAYVLPFVLLGGAFSVYHYHLELFPGRESGFCSSAAPCNVRWVWELGYVSIPMLALTAFASIAALVLLASARPHEPAGSQEWEDRRV
jgi:disulfide bond formation protein DsbB